MISAGDVADLLAERIEPLARDLLPGGHREGHEWRAGSIAGEAGHSLGVHLTGTKRGVWSDFSTGQKGDALDLVVAVLGQSKAEAIKWSKRWLGIEYGDAFVPSRPTPAPKPAEASAPDRWQRPWRAARPIGGTIAEVYLVNRGLRFTDLAGHVLRFAPRHGRKNPEGVLEHHPALLALLRDVRSGEPCGIQNIYLRPDGLDRLREKGKTIWGRAAGSAVMLDEFEDVTYGLVVAEGVETAIALHMRALRPVWAAGGAGNLGELPVLAGIECLTVAADNDAAGREAAIKVSRRWQSAKREVLTITPPKGDWADAVTKGRAG